MKIFSFVIQKEKNKYYGEFYDFPCFISAKNINELVEQAHIALKIYISEMRLLGEKIKEPENYEKIKKIKCDEQIIPIVIEETDSNASHRKEKLIKKNVTIPEWVNLLSIKYEIPFSETLKKALIEEIKCKINS